MAYLKWDADLLLFTDDFRELCVDDPWIQLTAHQQSTLVVLYVAEIRRLLQPYRRRETLKTQQNMTAWTRNDNNNNFYKLDAKLQVSIINFLTLMYRNLP